MLSALVLAVSTQASAQMNADWLKIGGQISFDATGSDSNDFERNLKTSDAELIFEVALHEGIKAVVRTELERQLMLNGVEVGSSNFDVEKFIEEAYIRIETDKVSGLPRAIVTLGKHSMAFGQQISEMPMFKDNLLYKVGREDEVIGLTVSMNTNLLKIVDQVAVSIFETGRGDLDISDKKGASVKLSKQLTQKIQATASALYKESLTAGGEDEMRGSLGVLFDNGDGTFRMWAEGMVLKNNPVYADSDLAATAGASKKLGPGSVVVEYSYVERFAQELATAYNLPVGKHLVISPEVRHTFERANNQKADTRVGVRARLHFADTTPVKPLMTGKKK